MTMNNQSFDGKVDLLPLNPNLPPEQLLQNLRMNALLAHQRSVGRGDELVDILRNTIRQMEVTHTRIQLMSTLLFFAGLLLLAVAVVMSISGRGQEFANGIAALVGGTLTFASTFWNKPLEKISSSVSQLVKLEAVFLGYIRVIGELDSFFQMQYLDILAGSKKLSLDEVINDTTNQMKEIMGYSLDLIDKHVDRQISNSTALQDEIDELESRIKSLEDRS